MLGVDADADDRGIDAVIDVPEAVRNKARIAGCAGWLDQLPATLAHLADLWRVTIGPAYTDSTEAYVCAATRADGTAAAIKLLVPRDNRWTDREVAVLRLAAGEGCVRLLAHVPELHALLLEGLGPSLFDLGLPIGHRHEILCDTAARLWRPAPGADLPTGAQKAEWLIDSISQRWEQLGRPCSEQAVDQAMRCAERRRDAHDDERAVLVHGDVHQWNVLRAADGGFKLVDPDGLLAEPEYDLGIIMREDPIELMSGHPDQRARWLAARTGLDPVAIRDWGIVERVSTGLLCAEIDLQPVGREMLAAAEYVASYPASG